MTAERRSGLGTWGKSAGNTPRSLRKAHVIDDISFSRDFIVCTCAWKGPIDAFRTHRKDVGAHRH